MRRAARVDATQAEVVSALRAAGAFVWVIGLPVDLLVGVAGRMALAEVKSLTGKKAPRAKAYTPLQLDFMARWPGPPVETLTGAADALALVERMRA